MVEKTRTRRQRGFILTEAGLQRLQQTLQEAEIDRNDGKPLSLEQIAEFGDLDTHTVRRALSRVERVDRTTLVRLFRGIGLELRGEDFTKPATACRQNWSDIAREGDFLGRQQELETLSQWTGPERCRTVAIYGMAGIGKTALAWEAARQWRDRFECIVWRSLQEPAPPREFLQDLLEFLAPNLRQDPESTFSQKLVALLGALERQRCLLILDGVESLFIDWVRSGEYRAEWTDYGRFFEKIGAAAHRSCLLLTSRALPREVAIAEWETSPVRSLRLEGLSSHEVSKMLARRNLRASAEESAYLTQQYGGNPLLLRLVFPTIRTVFAGSVGDSLAQDFSVYGDVRDSLAVQLERLSAAERDTLFCLAIAREPVSLTQLLQISSLPTNDLVEALESLLRRAIVARQGSLFSCQPAVREYAAQLLLLDGVRKEISTVL